LKDSEGTPGNVQVIIFGDHTLIFASIFNIANVGEVVKLDGRKHIVLSMNHAKRLIVFNKNITALLGSLSHVPTIIFLGEKTPRTTGAWKQQVYHL